MSEGNRIDWKRIESLMLRSFRGEKMYDDEMDLIQLAHRKHPDRYRDLNRRVRANEIERIRSLDRK
jgi:hypothetical protein